MMTYENLKDALDLKFKGFWSIGVVPKELDFNERWIVLSFIDDIPTIADNVIYKQNQRYQLALYSTDIEDNIDDFFIDNELVYEMKTQLYIDLDNGYQTVYTFFL